ncbi:DNA-binding protein [Pedobacter ginsengisoli]|uniref:DNA-binding protein n=1 Tax=Pedobacter ginsengisoli TaxID=363852 RepID=A0A2D1U358_9SPHI|nr:helix-turn-helix domain-containing protein [Pedobacter ginsengisoli]ATP56040.1 DNA-binding protein [Pedobacter ginsengisoli]
MKNTELAKRIKALRSRKGMSQEELAEVSQLSLRTIQRIEGGETEARGDTLQRLAKALNISPDELIDWAENEDRGFLVVLNLSALSFIAFPILGIVVPLALWMLKKDKIKYVNETGKKLLNFQISWCILASFFTIFPMIIQIFHIGGSLFRAFQVFNLGAIEAFILMVPILYSVNLAFIIVNTIRSYNFQKVYYKPAIPFLR